MEAFWKRYRFSSKTQGLCFSLARKEESHLEKTSFLLTHCVTLVATCSPDSSHAFLIGCFQKQGCCVFCNLQERPGKVQHLEAEDQGYEPSSLWGSGADEWGNGYDFYPLHLLLSVRKFDIWADGSWRSELDQSGGEEFWERGVLVKEVLQSLGMHKHLPNIAGVFLMFSMWL